MCIWAQKSNLLAAAATHGFWISIRSKSVYIKVRIYNSRQCVGAYILAVCACIYMYTCARMCLNGNHLYNRYFLLCACSLSSGDNSCAARSIAAYRKIFRLSPQFRFDVRALMCRRRRRFFFFFEDFFEEQTQREREKSQRRAVIIMRIIPSSEKFVIN